VKSEKRVRCYANAARAQAMLRPVRFVGDYHGFAGIRIFGGSCEAECRDRARLHEERASVVRSGP
jgi:hypothetical protein